MPFGIAAVVFQMFDGVMPEAIRGKRIHEVIRGIKDSVSSDEPLYVNVYEEDGEHVEVYIG